MGQGHTTKLQGDLDLLANGDIAAKARIIAHTQERMRSIAHQMLRRFPKVKRWAETDDVLQNALIKLQETLAAESPRSPTHFYALAKMRLRWELLDLARKYSGREGIGRNHQSDPEGNSLKNVQAGGKPESAEQWEAFLERVAKLSEDEQQLFDLHWEGELTDQQVADFLGISLSGAKRRWRDLKEKLGAGEDERR